MQTSKLTVVAPKATKTAPYHLKMKKMLNKKKKKPLKKNIKPLKTKKKHQQKKIDQQDSENGDYFFHIPGPPAEVFYSKDNMVKSVRNFAADHG